jgi:hypothetical protein
MANNAFNFKGIYDKIAGLLKTSDIIDPTLYTPSSDDYVAVYKNIPGSPSINGNTIAIKNYVSVTDIGGGSGPLPDNVMTSFGVSSTGGITLSVDDGATYTEGPFTIENLDELIINSSSVPNGLNWRGDFDNPSTGSTFEINDVVYTTTGTPAVYRTWFAIQEQPVSGAVAPPTNTDYSNAYWALLGTQGPAGSTGPAGPPSATATFGFKPVSSTGVYTQIDTSGSPGTGSNDVGKIFLLNNNGPSTSELVVTINAGLSGGAGTSAGWPFNSQITFMNVTPDIVASTGALTGPVKIVGASGVTINSADGAKYLRTEFSTCSVVRRSQNEYYMFGDLTNIA